MTAPAYNWQKYFTDVTSTANFTGGSIKCMGYRQLVLAVKWPSIAGTVFTWALEGAGTFNSQSPFSGPDASTDWIDLAPTSGIYGTFPATVAATAGRFALVITNPMPLMRLTGVLTSGAGAASSFNGWYYLVE